MSRQCLRMRDCSHSTAVVAQCLLAEETAEVCAFQRLRARFVAWTLQHLKFYLDILSALEIPALNWHLYASGLKDVFVIQSGLALPKLYFSMNLGIFFVCLLVSGKYLLLFGKQSLQERFFFTECYGCVLSTSGNTGQIYITKMYKNTVLNGNNILRIYDS